MFKQYSSLNTLDSLEHPLELGINVEDGLKELIDNSVDAGATHVDDVIPNTSESKSIRSRRGTIEDELIRLVVADNGHGIPATIEDQHGVEQPGLAYCMLSVVALRIFSGREKAHPSGVLDGACPPPSLPLPKNVARRLFGPAKRAMKNGAVANGSMTL